MDSRTRLETAWSFREPDRVPIELALHTNARELPEAEWLVDFEANKADNFLGAPAFAWGFFGLESEYTEEILEDVPGDYRRMKRTHTTEAGDFCAITKHRYDEYNPQDFHWERRFIDTVEELERLGSAPRSAIPFNRTAYERALAGHGNRGIACAGLAHPLGRLVRWANMEEVYIWMSREKRIIHTFLESTNDQVAASVAEIAKTGLKVDFRSVALEMLIPPWMGPQAFDELVFPYDKKVNDAVHRIGGRVRSHCHGNCGEFLERFAEMGIDALEPLEPPPYGDNDLAEAKRRVGDRMLLSGNITSQDFPFMPEEDVRQAVKDAIRAGAPGGGFTIRCTGGNCGTNSAKNVEQLRVFVRKIETFIETAIECGTYPIRGVD